MDIKTKFSIGDKVWQPTKRYEYLPMYQCPVCKGSGKSVINSAKTCRTVIDNIYRCVGGMICEGKYHYVPAFHLITEIAVNASKYTPVYIEYYVDDDSLALDESCFYFTEEDCQQACNELNQEVPK